jgi:hypothetical protein
MTKYSQTYIIILNSKKVGKEVVNEKVDRNGNRICVAEQVLESGPNAIDKKKKIIKTKMVIHEGQTFPSSFTYDSNTGINYELNVTDGKIVRKYQNQGDEPQITKVRFDPGMPMLNMAVYHTVDFWIRKYDVNKKGQQIFPTYILPSGQVAEMIVNPTSTALPQHDNKTLKLQNYEIVMNNDINILLWVDQNNRLYRMYIQGPNVEVLREDLFLKIEKEVKQKEKRH